ncbi:MAG: phosphotransferase [Spirochaetaceae bacterium]|jgi:5-methylthioribose kinase|nr:phosphotransferase [Spirochaetaceae bacterium]
MDCVAIKNYLLENCLSLFPSGMELSVTEIGRNETDGDGYVNYIYRIAVQNPDGSISSFILKHAKPYIKFFGKDAPLPPERNEAEVDINLLRAAIVPQYVPRILWTDKARHLYITEDWVCGNSCLTIMRFGLGRGARYPYFAAMMGEYIAKCNFYTSELYLDQGIHKELGRRFTAPEMSRIMEKILFTRETFGGGASGAPVPEFNGAPYDAVHKQLADSFWEKRDARLKLLCLRDIYMKKTECLVHGDLHTSNTLISGSEMKIIDMEYTHLGPFSADLGYLLGNLVYSYAAWFFHTEVDAQERAAFRAEMLRMIEGVLREYCRIFRECWERDVKPLFRPYPEYLESLLACCLRETAQFMGSQIVSRICAMAETFDFDVLPSRDDRNEARAICIACGYALLMQGENVQTPEDITRIIKACASAYFNADTIPAIPFR